MNWLEEKTAEGTRWRSTTPDGTWEIRETQEGCIGIPASGRAYPYSLVAGLFQAERSLAAAQILVQEASLCMADQPQEAQAAEPSSTFRMVCAGETFAFTETESGWQMSFVQAGVPAHQSSASLAELVALLPSAFAGSSPEARQRFSDEQDRARKRSVLAEKHSDAIEDASVVRRLMNRASNSASSRMKSVEYAFRTLRQIEMRQMKLMLKAGPSSPMAA
jgi:hypothetical protein